MQKNIIIIIVLFFVAHIASSQSMDTTSQVRIQLDSSIDQIPSLLEKVDISVSQLPISDFLRALAEAHKLNISLRGLGDEVVYNNFNDVLVIDLLVFLSEEFSLDIQVTNNILVFTRKVVPEVIDILYQTTGKVISFEFNEVPLQKVVRQITEQSKLNISLSENIRQQKVSGFVTELPIKIAIEQLAKANNLEIDSSDENVIFLSQKVPEQNQGSISSNQRRTSPQQAGSFDYSLMGAEDSLRITLSAYNADARDVLLQVAKKAEQQYILLNPLSGRINCQLVSATFEEFVQVILAASDEPMAYAMSSGVLMLGAETNLKLDRTQLYVFQNRSVDKMIESIPQSFSALQIIEYPELNAMAISGSQSSIETLIDFLQVIDQPVANVLIELIVVEINQGYTVSTGLTAGLSDSTVSSTGTVFPGIDFTLSSSSVNDFLEKIDRRGVINLGRVTPDFYVTLEALENNNFLDLKSTPKLSTLNGNEAELVIGRSVYYLIETQNVTGGVNPIVTVTPRYEKVEANLSINIRPFVSANEKVTLNIEAEFSDFIDPSVEGAPPGNATRKFLSKISIDNEDMIVLGGLEEASKTTAGRGTPILGRIPILKWIFNARSETERDNKLIVFIRPTISY